MDGTCHGGHSPSLCFPPSRFQLRPIGRRHLVTRGPTVFLVGLVMLVTFLIVALLFALHRLLEYERRRSLMASLPMVTGQRQVHRLLTCSWVHDDLGCVFIIARDPLSPRHCRHVIHNALFFLVLGPAAEALVGGWVVLGLVLAMGVVGYGLSLVCLKMKGGMADMYETCGFSPCTYGVEHFVVTMDPAARLGFVSRVFGLLALGVLGWSCHRHTWAGLPDLRWRTACVAVWATAIVMFLPGAGPPPAMLALVCHALHHAYDCVLLGRRQSSDHAGHLGGALFGTVCGLVLSPRSWAGPFYAMTIPVISGLYLVYLTVICVHPRLREGFLLSKTKADEEVTPNPE